MVRPLLRPDGMTIEAMPFPQTVGETGREIRAEIKTERRTKTTEGAPHLAGMLWFAGWLFTIGFAKLVWWKALLGLLVWPYFLGVILR